MAVSKALLHPLASKAIRLWPLEDLLLHTFRVGGARSTRVISPGTKKHGRWSPSVRHTGE
jgi:hypothetical protein